MSPVGDAFRTRCRQFPSLINCCTIDWYAAWPRSALHSVSTRFLSSVDLPSDEVRQQLAEMCVVVHQQTEEACSRFQGELRRIVYTTPKSYLDFVHLYIEMLKERRHQLMTQRNHLTTGLHKLAETKSVVGELQETLEKLRPILVAKTKETEVLLQQVANDQDRANKIRAVVEVEEKEVAKRTAEVREVQADAQADLDMALPALRAAIKSLEKLKKAEISEVKSMANPPIGVVRTMEAVCILLQVSPDWETAKKVLANVNFLKSLKEYDKDHIDVKIIKKLQKYVNDPELTEERMLNVSRAATSLLMWVNAMVEYSKVAKVVAPKKARVDQMNALLKEANAKLKEKQDQMSEISANIATLKEKCEKTQQEKNNLDAKTNQTEKRLERAEKLTRGLSTEEVRWAADCELIDAKLVTIVGNVFIASACVTYCGPFTGEYRASLVSKWVTDCHARSIPASPTFSLVDTLGSPVEIRQWTINGLPTDEVSIDSAILARRSFRWPLMIDPQEQAKKWIKNEHKNKLMITRFTHRDMLKTVELALKSGSPLLIEDVGEHVDASIDAVLLKQTFMKGDQKMLHLGENDVEYNDKFRLYMTTKLSNPHLLPETQIKVTLLNFTVTRSGLEEQLLGEVVKCENFEIQDKSNRLVIGIAKDRNNLVDIEERILIMLSESSGNVLDDEQLIDTLEESKFTSNVITERVKDTLETQKHIAVVREAYRSVAVRGSLLYFVIADLAVIDPMYEYSLSYFMRLFNLCMTQAEASSDLPTRLNNLLTHITRTIFHNISRGLFDRDKAIYAFLITVSIRREAGSIGALEWNFLLRDTSGTKVVMSEFLPNPAALSLTDRQWELICSLESTLTTFRGLSSDMGINTEAWVAYITSPTPQSIPLPGTWDTKLSPFQKLLILKVLRPEKLLFAMSDYVRNAFGREFVDISPPSLEDVYKDSDNKTPIIFVLSQGADPTERLFRLARDKNMTERLNVISLGQGQGDNASRLIETAKMRGEWLLLQNCHLAKSWMPTLEDQVDALTHDDSTVHEDFRLFLTSMPCDHFPVSVLQKGIKVTNEPPSGLRANLLRSYTTVLNTDEFERCSKPAPWKKLLFGLCFFHAMIQERKKFGPLGWNKTYEFNDSDLETSMQVLRMFLEEQQQIPWDALRYVCGEITYGGRVTDDQDRRCLMSILSRFYTPSILNDKYTFSPSGIYYAPAPGPLSSYISYIESLPSSPDVEIFGLHENANITHQTNTTNYIINTILSIQPREMTTATGRSSDEIVSEMCVEFYEHAPALVDKKKANAACFAVNAQGVMDSLSTVLLQEMERFARLLATIKRSLVDLQRAIKGEVVMSLELDGMYSSLLNNQVPEIWSRVSYPSLKPLASWMSDLHARIAFLNEWIVQGPPNSFWLSGLFFPQGFITGVLQNHARRYSIPIDTLTFQFQVTNMMDRKEVEVPPKDGVYIDGLYLDGARWDRTTQQLEDSHLGEVYSPVPVIHFIPTATDPSNGKDYVCPIYKTSVRAGVLSTTGQSTNYILSVQLPTSRDPSHWVLKGAALLTQLPT